MARLLGSAGHRVVLADTLRRPLGTATRFARYARLPSPRFAFAAFGDALARVIEREGVSLVIPTCEEVFHLARLWETRDMGAPLFAPEFERLAEVHSKAGSSLCALRLDWMCRRRRCSPRSPISMGSANGRTGWCSNLSGHGSEDRC
jgi:hypothetical protein